MFIVWKGSGVDLVVWKFFLKLIGIRHYVFLCLLEIGRFTSHNYNSPTTINLVWVFGNSGILKRRLLRIHIRNLKTWTDQSQVDIYNIITLLGLSIGLPKITYSSALIVSRSTTDSALENWTIDLQITVSDRLLSDAVINNYNNVMLLYYVVQVSTPRHWPTDLSYLPILEFSAIFFFIQPHTLMITRARII